MNTSLLKMQVESCSFLRKQILFAMFTFTDPCSTLNCQHMCVNTQSGPECLCSEGFDLNSDNKTCTGAFFYINVCFLRIQTD